MATVFVAIGSNIDPKTNLEKAAFLLRGKWPDVRFSSVYRTAPRDVTDQPDFLNAVCTFETDLSAEDLLQELQKIEQALGKNPPFRFGPRTMDLDLLLYDDIIQDSATLTLPHPRLTERRFMLEPLCELLEPGNVHPFFHMSYDDLLEKVGDQDVQRIDLAL